MGTNYFISKVTPLGSTTTYTVKDPIAQETIIGTQSSDTNAWTGKSNYINALYNGLTITYYLPRNGTSSNATLNLTLADNTTTGAVNCYYEGSTRITSQYKAGSMIILTYFTAGTISVAGTATTDNRWVAQGQYYADTKVTSEANHYAPSAASSALITASITGSAGSYSANTEYTVLTGIQAERDTKGHVTGVKYTAQKIKDTTYSSLAAANGGTAVSLVTTGEKYAWNQKTSNTGTVTTVTAGTGLTTTNGGSTDGGSITTTGTLYLTKVNSNTGSYGPSAAVTGSNGATINIPYITVDAYGRITAISNKVYTSVNTDNDTKNTAGSQQSTSKLFMIGATAQAANPLTYSNSAVYATDGAFAATSYKVAEAVTLQYNSTTQALDFVFA